MTVLCSASPWPWAAWWCRSLPLHNFAAGDTHVGFGPTEHVWRPVRCDRDDPPGPPAFPDSAHLLATAVPEVYNQACVCRAAGRHSPAGCIVLVRYT